MSESVPVPSDREPRGHDRIMPSSSTPLDIARLRQAARPASRRARGAALTALLSLGPALLLAGTPGKDGAQTVSASGTVVNEYAILAADVAIGATAVTVTSIADLPSLGAGDLVMIYQAQGATIDTTDTVNYGTVFSLNGAGNYELIGVTGVAGNVINLEATCGGLRNAYTTAGRTQVIRVPQYATLTIDATGSVVAPSWDGQRGGVVAIDVQSTTLVGPIDVSGRGFRGGATASTNANTTTVPTYRQNLPSLGGTKGESIAGSATTYDSLFGRYGRGAPANGGGGGNNHNAPGGGGANGDNARSWWITVGSVGGQGVMDGTVTGAGAPESAWTLDPGYIANANALTDSGGGGRGGYACATTAALTGDFLTFEPDNVYWGCQNSERAEVGGLGGRPLANDPAARLFLGGGGGAGQANNGVGGAGGNGGGLVVLVVAGAVTGASSIRADGAPGGNSSVIPQGQGAADSPGGGGGGGSIVIRAGLLSGISALARGGVGGTQTQPTVSPDYEGGGRGRGRLHRDLGRRHSEGRERRKRRDERPHKDRSLPHERRHARSRRPRQRHGGRPRDLHPPHCGSADDVHGGGWGRFGGVGVADGFGAGESGFSRLPWLFGGGSVGRV